ncbi:MAG: hypothetical protein AAFX99_12915 [Myxococcota bacterium]
MPKRITFYGIFILTALALTCACSEVTELPSDCTDNEFYSDEFSVCETCPSVELTTCPADCSYVLQDNELGCAEAVCVCDIPPDDSTALPSLTCGEDFFLDTTLLECSPCPEVAQPACDTCPMVGETRDEQGCTQPVCDCGNTQDCPPIAPVDCGDEACGCETVTETQGNCPMMACVCPEPLPEGFYLDTSGTCRSCEGIEPVPEGCPVP